MTVPAYTVSKIASVCKGTVHSDENSDPVIRDLLIDSRSLTDPEYCLFVALVTDRNDGHKYIEELYEKGVKYFLVSKIPNLKSEIQNPKYFIHVPDTLAALQELGANHRRQFDIPVIGITGSNGKTIVKEWIFQMLGRDYKIVRSPKSYNSQIGVPLSVWKITPENDLAVFEAGISEPGEMDYLEAIIRPTIGIFTNIGQSHDEYFKDQKQKVEEKLKLFRDARTLIYCSDQTLITECLREDAAYKNLKTFTWSRNHEADLTITAVEKEKEQTRIKALYKTDPIEFTIFFPDDASIENAIHCVSTMLLLGYPASRIPYPASLLTPIAMRLELKEAINHCSLINDSYNSDINSLSIALGFLNQQQQNKKTVILSDILQTGRDKDELYREIASMLTSYHISRIIGIGRDMVKHADDFPMQKSFFLNTDEFLLHFPLSTFQNEAILLKGARLFEFEKIDQLLQQKTHETVMEINLDAMIHNLNYYRSLLDPGTKTMAMVKAFSYGSGSYEIASVLQFHRVDYLAVAYADEGVELRKTGIHIPVMVMSPEEQSLDTLLKYNLEPEIYNLHILRLLEDAIIRNQTSIQQEIRIHIKLDTGMHRLGFVTSELDPLIEKLKNNPTIRVQSVFSHLAASDDPAEDEFTLSQIRFFKEMSDRITPMLSYPVLRHILNSAGIHRFPGSQFDMVRLGIGLYGVGSDPGEQSRLRNVTRLKTVITQIKNIPAGETIGYSRKGKAVRDMVIAIVPVGYADGLDRRLGNGHGKLYLNGEPVPIVGNICMDMTMIDVTGFGGSPTPAPSPVGEGKSPTPAPSPVGEGSVMYPVSRIHEGDEVVIFGDIHPVADLAREMETIPYEVLTGISRRVKRIYYYE